MHMAPSSVVAESIAWEIIAAFQRENSFSRRSSIETIIALMCD